MVICLVIRTLSCFNFFLSKSHIEIYFNTILLTYIINNIIVDHYNRNIFERPKIMKEERTIHLPVNCFFNNNADCSSDIKIDFVS